MLLFIVLLILTGLTMANQQQEQRVNFIELGNVVCEGKDAGNYTYLDPYNTDAECTSESAEGATQGYFLIYCSPKGERTVNDLKQLARSTYPAGAFAQFDSLFLVSSGNLEGKYIYLSEIFMREAYLKKCSSVLGYSYVMTKSQTFLIAEKLVVDVFVKPEGAYNPFLKISSSVCKGQSYIV